MKIVYKNTNELIPYARNSRTHSDEQIKQIAASIKEFGFNCPVLIDLDGIIVAGHGRVRAAKKLNLKKVPCIQIEHLSEEQKKAFIIADNKIALNAGWDKELLQLELQELKKSDFDLFLTGFNVNELNIDFPIFEKPNSENEIKSEADLIGIYRPSLNKKRSLSFFSCRRFSSGNEKEEIKWIKQQKKDCNADIIEKISNEVSELLNITFKNLKDFCITNPPPGATKPDKKHFATEIAKKIAEKNSIKYLQVFEPRYRKSNTHHPLLKKDDMRVVNAPDTSIIIFDDVATSGSTLEEATNSISENLFHISVAWIYESIKEKNIFSPS